MTKPNIRFIDIIFFIALVGFDILVYIFLGILLMGYDDNYMASKGVYGSLKSMTSTEKIIYILFQFWNLVNIFFAGKIAYKLFRYFKKPALQ
jgi:hypothetical protein